MNFGLQLPKRFKRGITTTCVKSIIEDTVKLRGDKTGLCVQHKRNGRSMLGRVAKKDTDTCAIDPLVV